MDFAKGHVDKEGARHVKRVYTDKDVLKKQ